MTHPTASPVESRLTSPVRTALTIIAGAALMTIAAKTQIPFWPVPMTLHTLAVMAFAIAFGPRIAVSIFLTYLAAGAAGLSVFSGSPERGIGLAYMVGPTGGYLAGYLAASWLVGTLALGKGTFGRVSAMLIGLVTVYALGAAWLAAYVPLDRLLSVGVVPFLLGDLMKIGLVAAGAATLPATFTQLRGKRP
ncbi:biotin transporter BioY [Agrobacterium sp. SHOUNA12C]|uniref:Biotin transporter n=1 Tax=Rhizobium rhizogenes NBRC 13257 TaxID=1220581 RepID=A0AA87Q6M5_RHIRH|nr:biotin transporter BioY [Rhizobium rhizogenes]MCJ9720749.1 biotin transporter BioY [Agrobacterium sp. BETTINA12B]MCJ9756978.1 biotin transporter BioY [Agrobacterium sp. SHOUNA12C]NTF49530.1 biotin transporter BioY [Rhizobium rhizogenes]NTF94768.1 biotin transporter BioY [Rhizobium rhizogenes]NTG35414.1 biotin transporter BioY [Rhizobium rhizogenes]